MNGALVAARFVHFASTQTLFGAALFAAALAPASFAPDLAPLLRRLAAPLALLAFASALAWLALVARDMAGDAVDLDTLGEVATGTAFGRIWLARLALLAALTVAALRPDRRWRAPALAAGLATASLGLVGHAAMQEGALGAAHRLNHAVHLVAAAAWLGGLPPFVVALAAFTARARRDALTAMRRYSRLGHVVVAALFLSGALDVALTSGRWPWPPATPWRLGVAAKLALFSAMTALALVNRYALAPRCAHQRGAARALRLGALAEIGLGLSAVAVASASATFEPS